MGGGALPMILRWAGGGTSNKFGWGGWGVIPMILRWGGGGGTSNNFGWGGKFR